jgi:hypothetical protein
MAFDWRAFLQQWSREWLEDERFRAQMPDEVVASRWLGFPGATEEQIASAEARLGIALPPSYRAFLKISNGWRNTTTAIHRLWSTDEIEWLRLRRQGFINVFTAQLTIDCWEKRYVPSALEVSDWGDSAIYLLNPRVTRADDECEAAFFANWAAGAHVDASFQELMQSEYRTFRALRGKDLG